MHYSTFFKTHNPNKGENVKISLTGAVTPEIIQKLKSKISQARKKKIVLVIDSLGGSADAGLDFYDFLKKEQENGRKIIGWVPKQAGSSALLIFEGCSRRICSPEAKFKIHNVNVFYHLGINRTTSWNRLMANISKVYRHAKRLQRNFDEATIASTFLPRQKLVQFSNDGSNGDEPLSAKEAKMYGFVDTISWSCPS